MREPTLIDGPFTMEYKFSFDIIDYAKNSENMSVMDGSFKIRNNLIIWVILRDETNINSLFMRRVITQIYYGIEGVPFNTVGWKDLLRGLSIVSLSKSPIAESSIQTFKR